MVTPTHTLPSPPFPSTHLRTTTPPLANNPATSQGNDTPAFILAALTAGGGLTGFIRTGSVPSVAAGLTVGALYGLGGFRMQKGQPYGLELALLASVILAGSSIPRAVRTQKPLPAGLSVLAIYGLVQFGGAWSRRL